MGAGIRKTETKRNWKIADNAVSEAIARHLRVDSVIWAIKPTPDGPKESISIEFVPMTEEEAAEWEAEAKAEADDAPTPSSAPSLAVFERGMES